MEYYISSGSGQYQDEATMSLAYDTMSNSVTTTFSPSPTTFNIPWQMNVDVTGIDTVRFGSENLGGVGGR